MASSANLNTADVAFSNDVITHQGKPEEKPKKSELDISEIPKEGSTSGGFRQNLWVSANKFKGSAFPKIEHPDRLLKIFWILIYLVFTGILVLQISILLAQYFDYPVEISVKVVSQESQEFPAVTVCNNNPVKKSLTARVRAYQDLALLGEYMMHMILDQIKSAA